MSFKDSGTIRGSPEEVKERHARYLMAVNNPLRRKILRALKDGEATVEALKPRTGLEAATLVWHLSILEYDFCVERITKNGEVFYKLTQEGKIIDYVG